MPKLRVGSTIFTGELSKIREIVTALAKTSGAPASLTASAAEIEKKAETEKKRESTIIIVYFDAQKALAQQIERELLTKGYAANAVYSDYSELETSKKGPMESIRFVYAAAAASQAVADSVKKEIQSQTSALKSLPDEMRAQMAADLRILLF